MTPRCMLEALVKKIKLNELGKRLWAREKPKSPIISKTPTIHAPGTCEENKVEWTGKTHFWDREKTNIQLQVRLPRCMLQALVEEKRKKVEWTRKTHFWEREKQNLQLQVNLIHCSRHRSFYARGTDWGKEMKLNELETLIFEAELLAVGEAWNGMFSPVWGLVEGPFDSSGFSTSAGTLLWVFAGLYNMASL